MTSSANLVFQLQHTSVMALEYDVSRRWQNFNKYSPKRIKTTAMSEHTQSPQRLQTKKTPLAPRLYKLCPLRPLLTHRVVRDEFKLKKYLPFSTHTQRSVRNWPKTTQSPHTAHTNLWRAVRKDYRICLIMMHNSVAYVREDLTLTHPAIYTRELTTAHNNPLRAQVRNNCKLYYKAQHSSLIRDKHHPSQSPFDFKL